MTNILGIDIECDEKGNLELDYDNLAGLAKNHLNDAIAFSAPVLLAHQLSAFKVRNGHMVALEVRDVANNQALNPIPIDRFIFGVGKKLPVSYDLSLKTRVTLISNGRVFRVVVKPSLGPLSKFPEERMAMLVTNYQREVINMDLAPYTEMVPTAVNYVCQQFLDNFDIGWNFMPDHHNGQLGKKMLALSLNLYDIWQTKINDES